MKIFIIGAGLGSKKYLTDYAKEKIENADVVITTERIFEKMKSLNKNCICCKIFEIVEIVQKVSNDNKNNIKTICILASGDISFFSISKSLKEKISEFSNDIEFVSGISSLQYLTAKLCISYDDIKIISVHGRDNKVVPFVCYNKNTFVLTGGDVKASNIIDKLIEVGLGNVIVTIGENLSDIKENILTEKALNLKNKKFDNLTVMLIKNINYKNYYEKINDEDFIRNKTPMTKESVRTISISYLGIKPDDTVLDIGAGTGSVTIEMARKAYEGTVYAIEKESNAIEIIKQNIQKFGAYNIEIFNAIAPDKINQIKLINKAFIGGSSGNLEKIIECLIKNNENIKIVVNAITLETLNETLNCFKLVNFETKIICLNVSNAFKVGKYNMMKAENPIYIISGCKKNEN